MAVCGVCHYAQLVSASIGQFACECLMLARAGQWLSLVLSLSLCMIMGLFCLDMKGSLSLSWATSGFLFLAT